jgi:hypothetical protein
LGTFKGWLGNIIRWRIADQRARRLPTGNPPDLLHGEKTWTLPDVRQIPESEDSGLEALWDQEWKTNLFETALRRIRQRVKEEHYLIFDFYVLKHWPVLKVSRRLRVSVGQVYLVKHQISRLIKKEIQVLERELD